MEEVVITSACRTPLGAFGGAFREIPATRLGSVAVRGALERVHLPPAAVDEVFLGQVLSAGCGQAPARQAALGAGLPESVPCTTVNKVCGSGLQAVLLAARAVRLGEARVVVAGGMESMSCAPYLVERARWGQRLGHGKLADSILRDGLLDATKEFHMGQAAELCARECGISREAQDAFAARSYRRALEAMEKGHFAAEIVPVEVGEKGGTRLVSEDEGPRAVDFDRLPRLKPVFQENGTVTAANASTLNDGAAACTVMSRRQAESLGLEPLGRVVAWAGYATAPEWFTTAPVPAIRAVLDRAGLALADIDLFEVNEAFAVVGEVAVRQLALDPEKVNVHGGAVALGHPIGASGARILVTLLHALRGRGGRRGVAAICIGGGEALAVVIEAGR